MIEVYKSNDYLKKSREIFGKLSNNNIDLNSDFNKEKINTRKNNNIKEENNQEKNYIKI